MSYLPYLPLLLIPILFAVFMFPMPVTRAHEAPKTSKTPTTQQPNAKEIAGYNKEKIRAMLAKIESSPAPKLEPGAMCYKMAAPPERIEYVCPTCHSKTLHSYPDTAGNSRELRQLLSFKLTSARRLIAEIQKITPAVSLSENNFCDKCCPNRGTPSLGVKIKFDDGTEKATDSIGDDDLRLLLGFFSGKLDYKTFNDGTCALKDSEKRLKQLLGEAPPKPVKIEKTKPEPA